MTILLFQYKAGLGLEHGNHPRVFIYSQDNREDDWKTQTESIRMIVGASEWASHWIEGSSVKEKVIPVEKRENIPHKKHSSYP